MKFKLLPKRVRILWPSKYRADQYWISISEVYGESSNYEGYARLSDIKVLLYFY